VGGGGGGGHPSRDEDVFPTPSPGSGMGERSWGLREENGRGEAAQGPQILWSYTHPTSETQAHKTGVPRKKDKIRFSGFDVRRTWKVFGGTRRICPGGKGSWRLGRGSRTTVLRAPIQWSFRHTRHMGEKETRPNITRQTSKALWLRSLLGKVIGKG